MTAGGFTPANHLKQEYLMNFLKKLAFRLVRDDIDTVLKAHDKAIMDHYYKIIDDVEDILKTRNDEINNILEEKLKSLDNKVEETKTELFSQLNRDVRDNIPTVRDVANELEVREIVDLLEDKLNYKKITGMVIDSFTKCAKDKLGA